MSTAHRPTWDPAQARDVKGGSRQFSVRDMAAYTKLKFRQPGQTSTGEVARRDLRADLLAAEEEARNKKRKAEGRPPVAITAGTEGAENEDAVKRRKLLQEALELDKDDDDDEANEQKGQNEDSEEESEDEDDTDELLRELEKIKRERAEEKARQEREQLASQAAQLGQSTGLNTTVPGTFSVKKRWDDDLIFKNQAMNQREKSGQFVNDLLRTEFHKKFMAKFIKFCALGGLLLDMAVLNDVHSGMRVKISATPPLPPVRAWLPLPSATSTQTISSFKSLICTSFPAFRGVSSSSLRLSIDGFELLDNSELTVVRDGDLICVETLEVAARDRLEQAVGQGAPHATQNRLEPASSRKRKRRMSTPSSSSSESEIESTTSSSTSESESSSESDDSSRPVTPALRKAEHPKLHVREHAQATPSAQPKPHVATPPAFVAPGYGKPQTRSRNLRRRLKRVHERESTGVAEGGPVSGANAVVPGKGAPAQAITPVVPDATRDAHTTPTLLSLSLRNKNKAKNFKSLIGKPLTPKIVFEYQEGDASASTSGAMATPGCLSKPQTPSTQALPRLIPPSSRSSLPPNLFVTSIDVEAGLHRGKKKRNMRIEYGNELGGQTEVVAAAADTMLDYGDDVDTDKPESEVDIDRLESVANAHWATLEKPTSEEQVVCGMIVGYKALGINPVTYTPEQCLTLGRVVSCDGRGVVLRPLRAREQVSFSGPVDEEDGVEAAAEGHTWDAIGLGDWRLVR